VAGAGIRSLDCVGLPLPYLITTRPSLFFEATSHELKGQGPMAPTEHPLWLHGGTLLVSALCLVCSVRVRYLNGLSIACWRGRWSGIEGRASKPAAEGGGRHSITQHRCWCQP
jgi:hypothetical protein